MVFCILGTQLLASDLPYSVTSLYSDFDSSGDVAFEDREVIKLEPAGV